MKPITALAVMTTLLTPTLSCADNSTTPPSPIPVPDGYALTYDDEFSGDKVDTNNWFVADWPDWIEGGQAYFSPDNVTVKDGSLVIHSEKRNFKDKPYVSGEVMSDGLMRQLYGRFEIRAKMPSTSGTWAVGKLAPSSDTWPPLIEIFTFFGDRTASIQQSNYSADLNGGVVGSGHVYSDAATNWSGWHVYSVDWTPTSLTWRIDGKVRQTENVGVPTEPMYLWLDNGVGGKYTGDPALGTYPADMLVDYIRVYRRKDDPPPVIAGPDDATTLPKATVTLSGMTGNAIASEKVTWEKTVGPGPVAFANASALGTTASFSVPGRYTLTLNVADGGISGSDSLSVLVYPANADILVPAKEAQAGYQIASAAVDVTKVQTVHEQMIVASRPSTYAPSEYVGQGYFQFDLSKVNVVHKAILRLYGGIEHGGDQPDWSCDVFDVPDTTWDPATITWTTKPALGDAIAKLTAHSCLYHCTERWIDVDLTDFVQSEFASGTKNLNLALAENDRTEMRDFLFSTQKDPTHDVRLLVY